MQIRLSQHSINRTAPYRVDTSNGYSFSFKTRYGHLYEVGFTEDYMLSDDGLVFQFFITCLDADHPQKDNGVKETVMAILEEFFKNDLVSLVYICDTHDGRQASRQRLFASLFHQYRLSSFYDFSCKSLSVDGIDYYLSFLCKKENPLRADRKDALDGIYSRIAGK